MSVETLKTSLEWQERIAASAKDPAQKQRCLDRATRLRMQIAALEAEGRT